MAEYWVHPESGDDGNAGTEAAPWRLIPGQTGANTVSAGDTINVKNGTTTTLQIILPANNLTYRGYGVADNVLSLTLPQPHSPTKTRTLTVVREAGVHEGMWTLDGSATDVNGILNSTTRTGCTVEDVDVRGFQTGTRNAVVLANSVANVSGFTMRRFSIEGSSVNGISAFTKAITLEYGRIRYTQGDNITINATAANSSRASSTDTLRYLQLEYPNIASPGAEVTGDDGDCVHLVPVAGGVASNIVAEHLYCHVTAQIKQVIVLHCSGSASQSWKNIHMTGTGRKSVLVGHIDGAVSFDGVAVVGDAPAAANLPVFRFENAESSPPAYAMNTGATLSIKRVSVVGEHSGLYRTFDASSASWDGSITIDGVTVNGSNTNTLSSAALLGLYGVGDSATWGVNFSLSATNIASNSDGYGVRLPAGMADDARFVVSGCAFAGQSHSIGATDYATVALFEAAHSGATGNVDGALMMSAEGRPLPGSPLIGAGSHLGYSTDIDGIQRFNPPTIGAYEAIRARGTASAREPRV